MPPRLLSLAGVLRALSLVFLLSILSGCAWVRSVPSEVSLAARTVEVPAGRDHGLFIVDAHINGQGPYRLAVDTGASMLTLTPRVVSEVGLKTRSLPWRVRSARGKEWSWRGSGRVDTIEIPGGVRIESMRFLEHECPLGLDGLLGNGVFDHCAMIVDEKGRTMWWTTDESPVLPGDIPLTYRGAVPTFALELDGEPVHVTLDSGCSSALKLPREHQENLRLGALLGSTTSHTLHGPQQNTVWQYVGKLEVGGHTLLRPPIHFSSGSRLAGLSLFRGYQMRIDLRTMTLRLRKPGESLDQSIESPGEPAR